MKIMMNVNRMPSQLSGHEIPNITTTTVVWDGALIARDSVKSVMDHKQR